MHGEYDQFQHIMRNGSGAVKLKVEQEFGTTFSKAEKKNIAALIYYPERKLEEVARHEQNIEDWYRVTLYRLIPICKNASSKYTRFAIPIFRPLIPSVRMISLLRNRK